MSLFSDIPIPRLSPFCIRLKINNIQSKSRLSLYLLLINNISRVSDVGDIEVVDYNNRPSHAIPLFLLYLVLRTTSIVILYVHVLFLLSLRKLTGTLQCQEFSLQNQPFTMVLWFSPHNSSLRPSLTIKLFLGY